MKQLVSPKLRRKQKSFLWVFMILLLVLGVITIGVAIESDNFLTLFSLPLYLILPFIFYKDLKRMKSISYDDSKLYYSSRVDEPEKSTPLENIRSITIGNFTATFRINLYTPNEDGQQIYFKFPEIWNPFATKKRLTAIYQLRDAIDACKARVDGDFEGETQIIRLAEV